MKAHPRPFVVPQIYMDIQEDFAGFKHHALIAQHTWTESWPTWECHPHGDEIVYLLSGDTDFTLRLPTGDKTLRLNAPGQYVVVPTGIWHTAKGHKETACLFITAGEGTLNEAEPPER